MAASLGGLGLADAAMTLAAAAERFGQGLHWSDKTDPLVIDLAAPPANDNLWTPFGEAA